MYDYPDRHTSNRQNNEPRGTNWQRRQAVEYRRGRREKARSNERSRERIYPGRRQLGPLIVDEIHCAISA